MTTDEQPNAAPETTAKTPNSPAERIKDRYLVVGEQDKFTKTTEYQTSYISFRSDLVDNYCKSKSQFGIGSAIINFSILYRQKGDIDALLVEMKITYITTEDHWANPNILKNLNIIFLADGEPIECNNATAHDFGKGQYTGFDELGMVEMSMDQLIQLVNAKEVEFRMSGDKGVFIEEKVDDAQLARIKGFYNGLFDPTFEVDFLLEAVKKQEAQDKKEAEELEKDLAETEKTSTTDTAAENNGCFVITAAMGDDNHPVVNDFRKFRDDHLINNLFGKLFVDFYYIVGPYFAWVISKSDSLRKLVFKYFVTPIHRNIKNGNK